MSLFCKPAFYAHALSAISMAIGFVLLIIHYKRILRTNPYQVILLMFVASIAIALHGHGHMKMEKDYGFDPLCQMLGH